VAGLVGAEGGLRRQSFEHPGVLDGDAGVIGQRGEGSDVVALESGELARPLGDGDDPDDALRGGDGGGHGVGRAEAAEHVRFEGAARTPQGEQRVPLDGAEGVGPVHLAQRRG
jgi:hypothetical protein